MPVLDVAGATAADRHRRHTYHVVHNVKAHRENLVFFVDEQSGTEVKHSARHYDCGSAPVADLQI